MTGIPALRGILVPLDGSELAEQAIAVGTAQARATGATLHLVGVHEPLPLSAMPPDYPLPVQALDAEARDQHVHYMESVAARVRARLASPVEFSLLNGEPAAALCEYADSHLVDMVVMTTHGRSGLGRFWLGSVADRMLRRLAVPVLLLHPQETPQPLELRHLLIALDGEIEAPVLEAVELLARDGVNRRYTLVRVVEPVIPILSGLAARPAHLPRDWDVRRLTEARNYLARLTERLGSRGWTVSWQVLVGRGVPERVLELAGTIGADGIVVGTHGARGMERMLLGSVADKIVRGAGVPVLVAPVGHPRRSERRHHLAGDEALLVGGNDIDRK